MALIEDIFKGNPLTAFAIGVGAVLLAPPALQVLRPMAKELIKGGMLAYRGLAELGELTGDIIAEAQHELVQQATDTQPPTPAVSTRRRQTPRSS